MEPVHTENKSLEIGNFDLSAKNGTGSTQSVNLFIPLGCAREDDGPKYGGN